VNKLSKQRTYTMTILAYPGMTMLDAVGPNEVLANSPYFDVEWVSTSKQPFTNDLASFNLSGLRYFLDIDKTDILLIPGGPGEHAVMQNEAVIAWVKKIDKTSVYTTSVCTGSLILAKAGLLNNRSASTHWGCLDELTALGANTSRKRYIQSGKYITAAGVSAGIDMALYMLKTLVSTKHSRDLRFGIEYFPNQIHVISSYTLPRFALRKLSARFGQFYTKTRLRFRADE